jgi:hypothetical protein
MSNQTLREYLLSNRECLNGRYEETAKLFNTTAERVRNKARKIRRDLGLSKPKEKAPSSYTFDNKGDSAELTAVVSKQIKTLYELVKVCSIDLETWDVDRYVVNAWGVTSWKTGAAEMGQNYQVKAWLKRKVVSEQEATIKELIDQIKAYTQPVLAYNYPVQTDHAVILNLYDAHIDKVCLLSETREEGSLEKNIATFEILFDSILAPAISYNPELIIIPVGHDFFNTNGNTNTTKRGTPQDTEVKSNKSFKVGVELLRRCIDKAAQVAKVQVRVIFGNHSEDKDFYLGQVLSAVYENNANVDVITEDQELKSQYEQYGVNLFGFAHGDTEIKNITQLPLLMAEQAKQKWADTKFRYFYLGDKHHKMEYKFLRTKDFIGCTVSFLRSVGTSDKWHTDNGYIGVPKTAEAHIWHKEKGLKTILMANG